MTDPGTEPANLDPHGRPLGGQLERDARLLAAAQALDLTEGSCDNTTREYWYDRTRETYELLRRYGRDDDIADFVTKAQNLQLITAQNDDLGEQVDAALGHRYHRPGVHYSVPHVAEKAAAELKELQAQLDEIRVVLAEDAETRARFQVDVSTSYGPRFLSRIRAIVEHESSVRAALQGAQPAEPKPAAAPSEDDVRALRLHLASVHKLANAFDLPAADLDDIHQHDHFGPCGLRSHDVADRSYDEATARAVAAEADDQPAGEAGHA